MTNREHLISFSSQAKPDISIVGGKAASLIHLTQAGFNVPEGFVLPVGFFDDWSRQLSLSSAWQQLLTAQPNELAEFTDICNQLKELATKLTYSNVQLDTVQQVIRTFCCDIFAVRSSSPDEDLSDSSFAGLYETQLNVPKNNVPDAIRECYLSCLDARVFIYKQKQNLPFVFPQIAIVIQTQIKSEVAGVLFSLNPLNNDFDEAVINATFGLGEALVAGEITPDSWTVNKVTNDVIDFKNADLACLSHTQIRQLVKTACSIEKVYAEPVDIEWAFADQQLYLLQARPITTYIPIHPDMQTKPGEPRILYMDESLADGLTISGPVSRLTNDFVMVLSQRLIHTVDENVEINLPAKNALIFSSGVRLYLNLTKLMGWMKLSLMAPSKRTIDATYADILETCDFSRYNRHQKVSLGQKLKVIKFLFKAAWKMRGFFSALIKARFTLETFQKNYDEEITEFEKFLKEPAPFDQPFVDYLLHYYVPFIKVTFSASAPALCLYILRGTELLGKLINQDSNEQVALSAAIQSGSDDMVMEMGMRLYELSICLPAKDFSDLEKLSRKIQDRTVNREFLILWDQFQEIFGCRGPMEMELAQAKYSEDPMLVLKQIATIVKGGKKFDPRKKHQELKVNRLRAYTKLGEMLSKRQRKKLVTAFKTICDFEHSREVPKDHLVTIHKRVREYLLHQATLWVEEKRLNNINQIFELTVDEIEQAQQHADFDLLKALDNRDPYFERAKRVRHFPHAIDSRGRIIRPKRDLVPGQLCGVPVSSGIVTGPVKVLNNPFEKEIEEGDILVAYTTDPGWTPLFINAAAVLLEVGGELQHGALVAREYGKPCIAGIVNVTKDLKDGQMVEVDGNTGQVRLLEPLDADQALDLA